MKASIAKHRRLLLETGALLLLLAVTITPIGQRGVAGLFSAVTYIGAEVIDFPCKVVAGFRNLSLNHLAPTCPQCI
jgi:hypothetical protein